MPHARNVWKDHMVERPRTYSMIENEDGTYTLVPQPGTVFQQGTPQSANHFNRIEETITHYATAFDFFASIMQAKVRENDSISEKLLALLLQKVLWTTVTLEANGWTGLEQKKKVDALKADHIVIAVGAVENHDQYNGFGIKPVKQADGELTFAATLKPDVTLTALIVLLDGKEV